MSLLTTDRQEILEKVYAAANRILNGVGSDKDYEIECKFYTILIGSLSKADWDRLLHIIEG